MMIRYSWCFICFLMLTSCATIEEELSNTVTVEITASMEAESFPLIDTVLPSATNTNEAKATQTAIPLPTDFYITSTPDLGPFGAEVFQAPEGKFLFIELISTHDGVGDIGFAFIDIPTYRYDPTKGILSSNFTLSEMEFDASSWGLWGMKIIYQGATGTGVSSLLKSIDSLPNTENLENLSLRTGGVSYQFDPIEIRVKTVYQDGTVALNIEGVNTFLPPGQTWLHKVGKKVNSENSNGFYEITGQIINHGWLDREIIYPRP